MKIYLSKILDERRITQAELSRLTGIRPATINEWYNEIAIRITLEHLDRICEVLNCNVCDVLEYKKSAKTRTKSGLILEQHGNRKLEKSK